MVFVQVTGSRIVHEKGRALQITSSTSTSEEDVWLIWPLDDKKMLENWSEDHLIMRPMRWKGFCSALDTCYSRHVLAGRLDSACPSSNSTGRICTYVFADTSWRGLVFFIRKPRLVQKIQTAKSKIQTALFGNQSNIQNPTGGFCAWGTPTGNLDHYAIWRGVFDSPGPSIFCAHLFSGSATWKSEVALRLWDSVKYEYATRLWMWACPIFVFHVLHGIIPW